MDKMNTTVKKLDDLADDTGAASGKLLSNPALIDAQVPSHVPLPHFRSQKL
jgi:hypothetical protein